MVRASRPDLEVVGAFNPGVVQHEDETILLLRVSEAPRDIAPGEVAAPVYDARSDRVEVRRWRASEHAVNSTDPRVVVVDGRTWLTSISHLRIARSRDGIHFTVDERPSLFPGTAEEGY